MTSYVINLFNEPAKLADRVKASGGGVAGAWGQINKHREPTKWATEVFKIICRRAPRAQLVYSQVTQGCASLALGFYYAACFAGSLNMTAMEAVRAGIDPYGTMRAVRS